MNILTREIVRSCFGMPNKKIKLESFLSMIAGDLAHAQNNLNAAKTVRDADYYAGLVDAYEIVAKLLAPVKNKKLLHQCFGEYGTRDDIVDALRKVSL